jgi:hypothetical protein
MHCIYVFWMTDTINADGFPKIIKRLVSKWIQTLFWMGKDLNISISFILDEDQFKGLSIIEIKSIFATVLYSEAQLAARQKFTGDVSYIPPGYTYIHSCTPKWSTMYFTRTSLFFPVLHFTLESVLTYCSCRAIIAKSTKTSLQVFHCVLCFPCV